MFRDGQALFKSFQMQNCHDRIHEGRQLLNACEYLLVFELESISDTNFLQFKPSEILYESF